VTSNESSTKSQMVGRSPRALREIDSTSSTINLGQVFDGRQRAVGRALATCEDRPVAEAESCDAFDMSNMDRLNELLRTTCQGAFSFGRA